MGAGIVGWGIPVRGAAEARTDARTVCRGHDFGTNRTTLRIDAAGPIQMLSELRRRQKLSIGSIENVEEAVTVSLDQQFARLALIDGIDQNRSFFGVVIKQIMRRKLEIPFELAAVGIERQHA